MSSTVSRWLTAAKLPAKTGDDQSVQAAALIATVRPGASAATLATQLKTVVSQVGKLAGGRDILVALAADSRLPGWARLRVALSTTDAELIGSLERYTVPMTKVLGQDGGWDAPGIALLPPLRRAQLLLSGTFSNVKLTSDEVAEIAPKLLRDGWLALEPESVSALVSGMSVKPRSFKATWTMLRQEVLPLQMNSEAARAAYVALVASTKAFENVAGMKAFPVTCFLNVFDGATKVPALKSDAKPEFIHQLLGSHNELARRLGVALLEGTRAEMTPTMLDRLAVTPEAGDRLVTAFEYNADVKLLAARVTALGHLDRVGAAMLRKVPAEKLFASAQAADLETLHRVLGPQGWALGYKATHMLAQQHGYAQGLVLPPPCVRAEVATAAWLEPTPEMEELAGRLGRRGDSDKARCVLADDYINPESRYAPTQRMLGETSYLSQMVVQYLVYGGRSNGGWENQDDRQAHWIAWMRWMPASMMKWLLADTADVAERSDKRPAMPAALALYLEEVAEIAHTPRAREALSAALRAPIGTSVLPSTMTLGQFAAELRRADAAAA